MSNGLWAFVNGDSQEPISPSPPAGPPAVVASTASQAEDARTAALTVYTSLRSQYDAELAAYPDLLKAWQKSNNHGNWQHYPLPLSCSSAEPEY